MPMIPRRGEGRWRWDGMVRRDRRALAPDTYRYRPGLDLPPWPMVWTPDPWTVRLARRLKDLVGLVNGSK